MIEARKIVTTTEFVQFEQGRKLAEPITRMAGLAVVTNTFAGQFSDDLSALFEVGSAVGQHLSVTLAAQFDKPIVSYGKAAIVGAAGETEHGGACIHPMLGKPMRAAIDGGKAVIPSNVKVGGPGTSIDVPLGHKDNVWSFDHFDTMTVTVPDAPRPDEVVIIVAFADGGRPFPRCGSGPQ
ncbi:MAG: amino acid synthesis family protein [Pseudomonadota bacterium]